MQISRVIAPRTSEVIETEDLVPSATEVLVEVLACGVCTSDRKPWRSEGTAENPVRLGHEMAGRIVAVGSAESGWRVGDIVTGLGGNGFASHALMDANAILPVPAGIDPALSLGEPLACLVEALGRTPVSAGDRIAVVGLGFMGVGLIQLAKRELPGLLIGIDPNPDARARALRLGADEAYHPDEIPANYLSAGDTGHDDRMDVVLEAAGVDSSLAVMSALVRPYGAACIVGYHSSGTAKLDLELWYKAVTVVNGFSPDRRRTMAAMAKGLDLIALHRFDYAPLITHRFGLDEVDAAYELMESHDDGFVKSVIVP